MEKETPRVIIQDQLVNPDEVWGDKQRIVEIIGEGSGNGFKLENANLPKGWDESLENVKRIDFDRYVQSTSAECDLFGYDLREVTFDNNKILTKLIVANGNGNETSLELGGDFYSRTERAEYSTKNLAKIGAAVLMQSLISDYLSYGWGDDNFRYGRIGFSGDSMGGYYPTDLEIPENINIDDAVTNEYYQEMFINNANNIAGRFGTNLKNIEFTKNGLLHIAEVDGVNGCYYSLEGASTGKYGRQFHCHNVDSPRQAAALHGIVASYINFLLDRKS